MQYQIGQANRLGNRTNNQDRFAAIESEEGVLLVLADGMGGRLGGERAAELVVETAQKLFLERPRPITNPIRFFEEVVSKAHERITHIAEDFDQLPGTTGVLCLIQEGSATWAHVGDSRLYLFHDGLSLYRTVDHSYVEYLYQQGELSLEEIEAHPKRNQITRCIGCQPESPEVTVSHTVALSAGDVLLLCSDGFWSPLDDMQMAAMLQDADLEQCIDTIALEAEKASYPYSDNISAVALRVTDPTPSAREEPTEQAPRAADAAPDDHVRNAIDQIEQVMREYQDEFDNPSHD